MQVLLIHGLARTSLSLLNLEARLRQAGYQTQHFSYFAFLDSFDAIATRLQQRLHAIAAQGPYSIVAHSLGGILSRAALGSSGVPQPEHVVMLGPPNQLPRLAPMAWYLPPFRWYTGQCGFNLSCPEFYKALPGLQSPYTIVAGTNGPRGLLSPFGDEVNDGIVALSETRLSPHDRIVHLPVWHTFMMNHSAVQDQVVLALRNSSALGNAASTLAATTID
ncbi:MAG: esterase/lipase family protein [Thainema sp.]